MNPHQPRLSLKERWSAVVDIWRDVGQLLQKYRILLFPFLAISYTELLLLLLIALIPQFPFSHIFSAPIRLLWGEQFLHYPYHFLLMPHLFGYARMLVAVLLGIVMTGGVIRMIRDAEKGGRPTWKVGVQAALRCYLRLFAVWFLVVTLLGGLFQGFRFVIGKAWLTFGTWPLPYFLTICCFIIGVTIQVFFIYSMPAVILEDMKLVRALKHAFSVGRRLFFSTFVLTIIPTIPYLLYHSFSNNLPWLMQRFFPEVSFIFFGVGVLLHLVVDILVTASTTLLYIRRARDI